MLEQIKEFWNSIIFKISKIWNFQNSIALQFLIICISQFFEFSGPQDIKKDKKWKWKVQKRLNGKIYIRAFAT